MNYQLIGDVIAVGVGSVLFVIGYVNWWNSWGDVSPQTPEEMDAKCFTGYEQ